MDVWFLVCTVSSIYMPSMNGVKCGKMQGSFNGGYRYKVNTELIAGQNEIYEFIVGEHDKIILWRLVEIINYLDQLLNLP